MAISLPCFKPKAESEKLRIVYANDPVENAKYGVNRISNTKYSVLTFLPKNLYEQFGRFMNMYFLMIACLQLWSYITPVDPASTWVPLIVIFAISATKEAVDDYRRYLSDKKANERLFWVVRNGSKVKIQAQEIVAGDILYLENNNEIPCDAVLLSSSDPDGLCFIQTANLDGETDYKARQAIQQTASLRNDQDMSKFSGVVECAPPNPEIYRFDSRIKTERRSEQFYSLSDKQLLLQATHIKNTDWLYAMVVYTGNDTKVGKNKQKPPLKWTKQDRFINRTTIFIFCFQLTLVIVFGIVGNIWKYKNEDKLWYLNYGDQPAYEIVVIPLRFLLLNSMMIPISLKVTLDVIKFVYAKLIDWDLEMYDEEAGPANAANTSISEDMGQIQYIFSDKTGTLTENRMVFKKCSINGYVYGDVENGTALQDPALLSALSDKQPEETEFFKVLALCHSVVVTEHNKDSDPIYKASSPDEEALVKAAAEVKFVFTHSDSKTITVDFQGKPHIYDRLVQLDFSSDRKRMSVLLRDKSTGKLHLFVKGADEVILARLASGQNIQAAQTHLELFAGLGLRTLCIASREVSQTEYDQWLPIFTAAQTSVDDRDKLVAEASELLEKNFRLIGVSAIEDQLQEKVPETIQSLREAGLKIWMLTGDKYTTAVQIATSCNLISNVEERQQQTASPKKKDTTEQLLPIRGPSAEEVHLSIQKAQNRATQLTAHSRHYSVIIEGKDLTVALKFSSDLLRLCLGAASVICCRVTPQQKAQVVKLVKDAGYMTLAIGDGGNDVVMIQEASIGVGIAGREGLQAARAADYAIGKFRFLKRLLLIHGRYSYIRTAFVAQYCFYKSLFICFIQIMYSFFSGFAGTSYFNTISLTLYNMVFTSIPPILFVLDKDVSEARVWNNPILYQDSQRGDHLNIKTMVLWALRALFHALVAFLITIWSFYDAGHGATIDYASISMVTFTSVIFINSITVFLESNYVTWLNHLGIWGSVVAYFLVMTGYNSMPSGTLYDVMFLLYQNPLYWFTVLLSIITAVVPVYAFHTFFGKGSKPLYNDLSIRLDQYTMTIHDKTPLLGEA